MDNLRKTEEALCSYFGWANCVNSILLQRGGITQFFLNDTTHTGTIFKKFKFLHREINELHEIRVYDTEELGRVLVIDGFIQFIEDRKDTFTSAITKDILLGDNHYENVLVIGAGDMVLLDHLVKQTNVVNVILLENDERVLENLDKFFDFGNRFKNSNKLNVVKNGIGEFLKKETRKFDVVFVDLCDIRKNNYFNEEFYNSVREVCNKEANIVQKLQDIDCIQEYQKKIIGSGFRWITSEFCEVPDHNTRFAILKAKN